MAEPQLMIPGFFPDPSICRVGADFFTVHSSFEYLPGVPLFHSTDLANWNHVGNVLDRPEQLPSAETGRGIFAPTIRHHAGRFWMTTTDMARIGQGQLVVHTDDPLGSWSKPIFVPGTSGIDPDLAWDEPGQAHLTWASFTDGGSIIQQAPVDLDAGQLLAAPRVLRRGGAQHTEGPHLYRRGDWWYLLTADGGTERGHMVWISRSRRIDGPFEPAPGPLLTRRSTHGMLQNTGHGDLVELADGTWAMAHLGVRIRGTTPSFHVNGRESFLTGIEWVDDWPVATSAPVRVVLPDTVVDEDFTGKLGPEWISPGRWVDEFAMLDGGLRLGAAGASPRMLGVRARDLEWDLEVVVAAGSPTVVVRMDDDHVLRVRLSQDMVVGELGLVGLTASIGEVRRVAQELTVVISCRTLTGSALERGGPDALRIAVVQDGVRMELGQVDGRYLSTEVAGGFTGRIVGVAEGAEPARVARLRHAAASR